MQADAILLQDLELVTRIGVTDEERAEGQRLTVSAKIWPTQGFRELGDKIEAAVDYADVARQIRELALARSDKLIETLAEAIAAHLLAAFPVARVEVELRKYILPEVNYVAVIIARERAAQS
ncbi:MAG: dihydroneopterin aldolase [Chthoniobacterales bacterium]